mgnify:CR=1 FL=1
MSEMVLIGGSAHPEFSQKIATNLGMSLLDVEIGKFSDGEINIKILENIRGTDVFVIQPTFPPGDNLLELLLIVDAVKRASCRRVTAVMPYFGYARQDRKDQPRVPIGAKLVADLISASGTDRVLTIDLHAPQIQGFFNIPLDHLYSAPVLLDYFMDRKGELVVLSPDVGSIKMARSFAKRLDAPLAIIDKRRPRANHAEVMHIIGDVKGRTCVLVDDLVDTAGTLCQAAKALKGHGAKKVVAYCTHPVLSGKARENLEGSLIDELVVTDTIPLADGMLETGKIRQLSVAEMMGETIRRMAESESVSSMYVD